MLESQTDEEICSFLYMSEAYYFNPKQLKRQQVTSLIYSTYIGHETNSETQVWS